ncbi:MAG: hypothetical protein IT350_15850 [Deltaproteobacteria bacterium]|nr:hypothetical protein [Deltaproteobacteria bacterium]
MAEEQKEEQLVTLLEQVVGAAATSARSLRLAMADRTAWPDYVYHIQKFTIKVQVALAFKEKKLFGLLGTQKEGATNSSVEFEMVAVPIPELPEPNP